MRPETQTVPANAGAAGLRAFFNIIERWHLGSQEGKTLLGTADSTYFRWKKQPNLAQVNPDTLERISYVLGIYKALHLIYSDESLADNWLKRSNTNVLFNGHPPMDRLLGGLVADLYVIRQHLDARRGIL